jgi:hypothetical protein
MADEEVEPASDRGDGKSEYHVGTHHERWSQLSECHDHHSAQRACAGRRYTHLCAYECGDWGKPFGTIDRSRPGPASHRPIEIQQGKKDDCDPENKKDSAFVIFDAQALQHLDADYDAWNPAGTQQEQNSVIDLPPAKIYGQNREFDYRSESESGSDCNSGLEVEEENENWRGDTAGAHTRQPDRTRDQKPDNIFHVGSAPN